MLFSQLDTQIDQLSVHRVGNKMQGEFYVLSDDQVVVADEVLADLLKHYFLTPFSKSGEVYQFFHSSGTLALNEVYHFSRDFFEGKLAFHELSKQVCKHLYESSNHPNIKAGELYVVHLQQVALEGRMHEAIGLFKSESKEPYLKVLPMQGAFDLGYEREAININKLDKGCLIINTESDGGYAVLAIDQTNRQQEAVYWKDHFLGLRIRNDAHAQTGNFLNVYKRFVGEGLDESFELDRTDKIDLLNRSMDYFKGKETFVREEFEEEVIGDPKAVSLFNDYRQQFEAEHEAPIAAEFAISAPALRKAAATYKSVLKLDKNFHIYVHGKREYIEKGYDTEKGMNFYKVYFNEER